MNKKITTCLALIFLLSFLCFCISCKKQNLKEETLPQKDNAVSESSSISAYPLQFEFDIEEKGYKVTGLKSEMEIDDLIIPDEYNGLPVTSIGKEAFRGNDFKTICLGNNVKTIDENAFESSSTIKMIKIPDNVEEIGSMAFFGCKRLESVIIGNGVKFIGDEAFGACDILFSLEIGENVNYMASNAFSYCRRLVEINNHSKIEVQYRKTGEYNLGTCALNIANKGDVFSSNLSKDNGFVVYTEGTEKFLVSYDGSEDKLTIPSYITRINQFAFYNIENIKEVWIGDNIKEIGEAAFYGCSVQSVFINANALTIKKESFAYCSNLFKVIIGDEILGIDDRAFYYCKKLSSVTLGKNMTDIHYEAFEECGKIVEVINNSRLDIRKESIGNGGVAENALVVSNCDANYTSRVSIDDGYIIYNEGLSFVLLSYVGEEKDLVIPNYVTEIMEKALIDEGMKSVVIGENVLAIGWFAFYRCYNLEKVTIGKSVVFIGGEAFSKCSSLESVIFEDTTDWFFQNYQETIRLMVTNATKNADNLSWNYTFGEWIKMTH